MKVFKCKICGRIVEEIREGAGISVCCDTEMTLLKPCSSDGAVEKHVPVVDIKGCNIKVCVGSVEHPMMETHFIEWIAVETVKGCQRKVLKPEEKPVVEFAITDDDSVVAVYAYCNLHGLWKAE